MKFGIVFEWFVEVDSFVFDKIGMLIKSGFDLDLMIFLKEEFSVMKVLF